MNEHNPFVFADYDPDTFSAKYTLKELRRHLMDTDRLLLQWSHTLQVRRQEAGARVVGMMKEPLPEEIPLEQFDCVEMFQGALLMEKIAAMRRELEEFDQDVSKLEKLNRGISP